MHAGWATLAKHKEKRLCVLGIIEPMWKRFGGSAGIARIWGDAIKEATALQRVRACEALFMLLNCADEHPDVLEDPTQWSDERLADEIERELMKNTLMLLKRNPAAVQACAQQFGYSLIRHG